MDKYTAINKIKKCLALAKSSEPHEAAAAMRQAQKLMEQCGIEHPELFAAGADEQWAKSGATKTPVRYEVALASMCASAYGCEMLFVHRLNERAVAIEGGYVFVGVTPGPEICRYTFEVLVRQLRAARRDYISTTLKRCGPKNKVARADEFCGGWVRAVRRSIDVSQPSESHRAIIDAYMRANYATTTVRNPRSREVTKRASTNADRVSGWIAGSRAKVVAGVGHNEKSLALECGHE